MPEPKKERMDKKLVEFVHNQAEQVGFGSITLEIKVQNGKVCYIQSQHVNYTLKVEY